MKRRLLALATLCVSGAALAHHSPAVFDQSRKVTITGVVTEFRWQSPHSWIRLDVTDEHGNVGNWGIEMNPATLLAREGWKSTTLKPGDKVSVTVHPLRTNEKGGQYVGITLPDGRKLGAKPEGVL